MDFGQLACLAADILSLVANRMPPADRGGRRRLAGYVVAAVAGAALGSAVSWVSHSPRPVAKREQGAGDPDAGATRVPQPTRRAAPSSRARLLLAAGAVLAGVGAGATAVHHGYVAADGLLLASLALSGVAVRGPARNPAAFVAAGVVFAAVSIASAWAAVSGYQQVADPYQLLLLAVFGVCGLTVLVLAAASWLPGWSYREPVLLVMQALALGALSLHGLALLGSTLSVPGISGSVLFYADQPPGQPLYLNVGVTPSPASGIPTFEFMDIVNPSTNTKPASWAVLLTGGARLAHLDGRGSKVRQQALPGRAAATGVLAEAAGLLLWGQVAPGSVEQFSGQPLSSYVSRDATQTAVSLPDFDLGSILNTDPTTLSRVTRDLGVPSTSSGGLSIGVDAGSVSLLNTQVTAFPALADPRFLSWTFHTETAPTYKLADLGAQDSLNSYSFALAVLLGAAGACLLAGLQALLSASASRKDLPAAHPDD